MKKLFLAVITLVLPLQCYAEDSSSYIDYRYVKPNATLYDILNSSATPDETFILNNTLFRLDFVYNKKKTEKLYSNILSKSESIPNSTDRYFSDKQIYLTRSVESIITYMLKDYAKDIGPIRIPLVISADKYRDSFFYDTKIFSDIGCKGYGIAESYIKGCELSTDERTDFLEVAYHPDLKMSDDPYQLNQITNNSLKESYSYKLLSNIPQLLGFRSSISTKGYQAPLSSLDKVLYSDFLENSVHEGLNFSDIHENCFVNSNESCGLYVKTDELKTLFSLKSNSDKSTRLNTKEYPYIHYALYLKPYVNIPRTILSSGSFINYGFYTQLELELLKAIGYKINTKEFFGNSLFSSGSPTKRQSVVFKSGFSAWSKENNDYKTDQASRVPLSIGTTIYGSYNDIVQEGTIASVGYGSVGIRVDGSFNTITVPKKTSIIENGHNSSGIAVTYGRDNVINIDGDVTASTEGGIAINLDFGSNVLSDYVEFQGSYHRVRTLDVKEKRMTREKGAAVRAPSDIRGPLVSKLNITGNVTGNKNAIYIDDTAHVKEINITNRAKINGDIVSLWEPFVNDKKTGVYVNSQHVNLISGKVQLDTNYDAKKSHVRAKILNDLKTNLYLGSDISHVSEKAKYKKENSRANISIDGNIIGKTINISAIGGVTNLSGYIDTNKLLINNASINIKTPNYMTNYVNTLDLSHGGQLNLANGNPEVIVIRDIIKATANSVISVDTKLDGTVIDVVLFTGETKAPDGVINFEPGLSYNEIKALSSDPKALLNLLNKFVKDRNFFLSQHGLTMRFPRHIWYTQGQMGRKVKCTIRGCYLGDFVKSYAYSSEKLPLWRYVLSFGGIILMLIAAYIFHRKTSSRFY